MNAIEATRAMIQNVEVLEDTTVDMVLLHPVLVARNYIFGVEQEKGKVVIMVNSLDWNRAMMEFMMNGKGDDISDEIYWTPVVVDEQLSQRVSGGVFRWISKLE